MAISNPFIRSYVHTPSTGTGKVVLGDVWLQVLAPKSCASVTPKNRITPSIALAFDIAIDTTKSVEFYTKWPTSGCEQMSRIKFDDGCDKLHEASRLRFNGVYA